MDPLQGSPWSAAGTVEAFAQSAPNGTLLAYAAQQEPAARILDIGCGAGRNAVPLARMGRHVLGVDLSWAMLGAAAQRYQRDPCGRLDLVLAPMERLPVRDSSMDLVIAHGIWNLARSAAGFRGAVREAARVARPDARLFVFTFSRTTLSPEARTVRGEPFVFTDFSGEPQCFLTAAELVAELADAGFEPDPAVPLTEHNRPRTGTLRTGAQGQIWNVGVFPQRSARACRWALARDVGKTPTFQI